MFLDHFDALMLKIKNIVLIYFRVKYTLKNNHNHTFKHAKLRQSAFF